MGLFSCVWAPVLVTQAEKLLARLAPYRSAIVLAAHIGLFALANWLAFVIRFEGSIPPAEAELLWRVIPLVVAVRAVALVPLGLHRGLWRYASVRDLQAIVATVLVSSGVLFAVVHGLWGFTAYPRSIFIIDALLVTVLLAGVRCLKRVFHGLGAATAGVAAVAHADDAAATVLADWIVATLLG